MSADIDPYLALMQQLSIETGQDLTPDANGVLTLEDGDIAISIESQPSEPSIYVHGVIDTVDMTESQALAEALRYNLFRQDVPGSWIALDPETNQLLLCHAAQKSTATPDSLMTMVVSLADAVRRMRAKRQHDETVQAAGPSVTYPNDFSVIRV